MQAGNPAYGCALEDAGATTGRGAGGLCGGIDSDLCSIPLSASEHVICSHPSLNHTFTHLLTHSLTQWLTPSRTAAARQAVRRAISCKITTLPPFGQILLSPGQDDVPLEK